MRPQLLRNERHEGMEQLQHLVEDPRGHRPRLGLGSIVVTHEDRLHQLEVPVAELSPGELVDGVGRLVELVGLERAAAAVTDRKSTRLNSSHANISYAVFCLKKK